MTTQPLRKYKTDSAFFRTRNKMLLSSSVLWYNRPKHGPCILSEWCSSERIEQDSVTMTKRQARVLRTGRSFTLYQTLVFHTKAHRKILTQGGKTGSIQISCPRVVTHYLQTKQEHKHKKCFWEKTGYRTDINLKDFRIQDPKKWSVPTFGAVVMLGSYLDLALGNKVRRSAHSAVHPLQTQRPCQGESHGKSLGKRNSKEPWRLPMRQTNDLSIWKNTLICYPFWQTSTIPLSAQSWKIGLWSAWVDSSPESHVSIHRVSPRLIVIFGSLGPSFCLSGVEPSKHELGAHVPCEYCISTPLSLSLSL